MLFCIPELIPDLFTTRAMNVDLRPLSTSPSFIPGRQICLFLLMILYPAASNPMQYMSIHDSGLVSVPHSATSYCVLFYVIALVSRHCITVPKFAFQWY